MTESGVQDPHDDVTRVLGSFLAHVENSDDVASVMIAPLIEKLDVATGPTLSLAATFAADDPIFEQAQASDLVRELHERAAKKDPALWLSQEALALSLAEKKVRPKPCRIWNDSPHGFRTSRRFSSRSRECTESSGGRRSILERSNNSSNASPKI